jgi:ATP-binding cassette subfamily G (WHITE) protein 2 (SNQ2)
VREALRFSARMRQDPSISIEQKYEYVEKVLAMMEMTHLGDALIGDMESGLGISVEERKRLTIGMELVGKPEILFLDGILFFSFSFLSHNYFVLLIIGSY